MGNNSRDPVDHRRTTRPRARESMKNTWRMPGLLLVGTGAAAFVMCLAAFALGRVGVGIAATIVALLATGAGLAWLAMEGRRVRDAQRERVTNHRGAAG
jgi:FtsH-binding integral membrane protein